MNAASFVTNDNNNALSSLVGGLSSFSGLLTNALGSIDSSVNNLREAHNESADLIRAMKIQLDLQGVKVTSLESESEDQRSKVEHAMRNLSVLERNMDSGLLNTSKQLHKEIISTRSSTKVDMNDLRGSISKSMSEALDAINNAPKLYSPAELPAYNPDSTPAESITFLVDRLAKLEEAMGLQQTFNHQLGTQINNNELIQKVYDAMNGKIEELQSTIKEAQEEAIRSKEEQGKLELQIAQMTGALCNRDKLREFKENIARDRRNSVHHHHQHEHQHYKSGDKGSDKVDAVNGDSAARDRRSSSRSESRSRSRSRSRPGSADVNALSDTDGALSDDADAATAAAKARSRSATRRQQSTERMGGPIPEGQREDDDASEANRDEARRRERRRSHRNRRSSTGERRRSTKQQRRSFDKDSGNAPIYDSSDIRSREPPRLIDSNRKYLDTGDYEIEYDDDDYGRDRRGRRRSQYTRRSSSHGKRDGADTGTSSATSGEGAGAAADQSKQAQDRIVRKPTEIKRSQPVTKRVKTFDSSSVDINDNNEPHVVQVAAIEVAESFKEGKDLKEATVAVALAEVAKKDESTDQAEVKVDIPSAAAESILQQQQEAQDIGSHEEGSFQDGSLSTASAEFYSSMDESNYADGSLTSSFEAREPSVTQEQLELVAKQAQEAVDRLKKNYDDQLNALQESVGTFKRIAFMVEDMKVNNESIKSKIAALATNDASFEDKRNAAQFKTIANMKDAWTRVRGEMLHGLESLADDSESDDGSATTNEIEQQRKEFITKSLDLVQQLDNCLEEFNPRDTLELTLDRLHPLLERIFRDAQVLQRMDAEARKSDALLRSFDDIICSDLTANLKNYIEDAIKASKPVLDESVHKISMKHQLDEVAYVVTHKADAKHVQDLEFELKSKMHEKLDSKEFHAVTSRLVTAAELQKLHGFVLENLSNPSSNRNPTAEPVAAGVDIEKANLMANPDFRDMFQRFELLGKQQQEVRAYCDQFVPREEVHEAMRAIIAEVKALKKGAVTHSIFREGLKMKADTVEMDRLVKTITEAIGDLNFADQVAGSSAAMHAKCLVCDKPITGKGGRGSGLKARAAMMSASTPLLGYSKADDLPAGAGEDRHRIPSTFARLTSMDPAVSAQEKAKVAAELHIVRSSIDPLPEIHSADSPRATGVTTGQQQQQSQINYNQRIRSSAGGGMGKMKLDTR